MTITFQTGWTGPEPLSYPMLEVPETRTGSLIMMPCVGVAHWPEPPSVESDTYLGELDDVVRIEKSARWPSWFFEKHGMDPIPPESIRQHAIDGRKLDRDSAAHAVGMDHPLDLFDAIVGWLGSRGARFKGVPYAHRPFLPLAFTLRTKLMVRLDARCHEMAETKWYYGYPRPYEVLEADPTRFTAYRTLAAGGHTHPEYGAGHPFLAAIVAQFIIEHLEDEDAEQFAGLIYAAAAHWGVWRILARVHVWTSCWAGFLHGLV